MHSSCTFEKHANSDFAAEDLAETGLLEDCVLTTCTNYEEKCVHEFVICSNHGQKSCGMVKASWQEGGGCVLVRFHYTQVGATRVKKHTILVVNCVPTMIAAHLALKLKSVAALMDNMHRLERSAQ